MVQKADIVKYRGTLSTQVGIVDKIFVFRKEEHAIIRWVKPVGMANRKTYAKTKALETLRTAAEAAQRGRKKRIEGLDESSESHDVKFVRED